MYPVKFVYLPVCTDHNQYNDKYLHSLNDNGDSSWSYCLGDSNSDLLGQTLLHLKTAAEYLHDSGIKGT